MASPITFFDNGDPSPARAASPRVARTRVATDQDLRGRATPPQRPGSSAGARPGSSAGSRRPGTSGAQRPGTSGARRKVSELRKLLDRGELPVALETSTVGRRLIWRTQVHSLNFEQFLPIFFSGLTEQKEPARTIARSGAIELLEACPEPQRVLAVLPQLMKLLKVALNTRDPAVVGVVLSVLQQLAVLPGVGEALAPHYRSVLPVFSMFRDKHGKSPVADVIQETLELLEAYGPDDAFEQIHRLIPAYESYLSPA